MVDQRASSTTALGYAGAGNLEIQLDGGLDLKTNPHVLESPKTTVADNALVSNQGVVKQLPSMAETSNLFTPVYTGGAVPNIEPFQQGAYFNIGEGKHLQDVGFSSSSAIVSLASESGLQYGPVSPLYPLTVCTRSFLGDNNYTGNQISPVDAPVSAQGSLLGGTDTRNVLVTFQPNAGGQGGGQLYVSNLNGNNTAQFRRLLDSSLPFAAITNYAIINDPLSPLRYYLLVNIDTDGLYCYTITLSGPPTAASPANPIASVVKTFIATVTSLTKLQLTLLDGYPVLVYADGTNVKCVTLQNGPGSTSNVVADFNTSANQLAAFSSPGRLYVAIGNSLRIMTFTNTAGAFTFTQQQAVNIDPDTTSPVAVTGVYNPAGQNITVFSRITENFTNTAMANAGYASTASLQYHVQSTQFTYNGTTVSNIRARYYRAEAGMLIRGKAFLLSNGTQGMADSGSAFCHIALGSAYTGDTAASFLGGNFIIDHNCQIVARFNDNGADPARVYNSPGAANSAAVGLSEVYRLNEPNNATLFELGFPFTTPTYSGSNTNYSAPASGASKIYSNRPYQLGTTVNLCNIIYQGQGAVVTPARCGKSLFLNGALSMEFDSRCLHETGFHFQASPPGPAHSISTTSATNPAGIYYYYVVYRWTDSNGQLHQSAPSPARAVNFSSTWTSANFMVWPPMATYKGLDTNVAGADGRWGNSPVYADLYRSSTASSDPTGAVAYLVTSKPLGNFQHSKPTNAPWGTILTDNATTTVKTSAPPLYTQSQIAANAPPSFIYTVNSKGRCFGLAQVGSTYRVYFSSPYSDVPVPFASRWNINGFVTVPPELGDCRSLAALDDKILIFGTAGVAAFNGDGPSIFDTTGSFNYTDNPTQLNYSAVTPLPMPLGTVGCGAPVTIPQGVLYQDRQGIMMVDRGLGATFVGGAVDTLTNVNRYGRPYLHPVLNSVVYPNARGAALVYCFELQRFSQWPALQNSVSVFQAANGTTFSVGAAFANGAVASNSRVFQIRDAANSTSDAVAQPTLVLETPWQHIGQGFGGEGSIWEALVTGQYYAPHTLQLQMAYDYGAYEAAQSVSYLTGSTTPQVPYQSRFRPPRRARADVVRFRVTVTPESGSKALECARLTGITLYAAAYRAGQRVGSGVQR